MPGAVALAFHAVLAKERHGWVMAQIVRAVEEAGDETTVARRLYISKCAKCHKFYDPAKYSDEDWEKWMGKMSKKAKLTPEQAKALSRYIENTFRNPPKQG